MKDRVDATLSFSDLDMVYGCQFLGELRFAVRSQTAPVAVYKCSSCDMSAKVNTGKTNDARTVGMIHLIGNCTKLNLGSAPHQENNLPNGGNLFIR